MEPAPSSAITLAHGRWCIVLGTLLWSLGGGFAKLLTRDSALGLNLPPIRPEAIACYRVLFAGLVLLPTLRRCDLSFRRMMLVMVVCFGSMNYLYVRALTEGSAANAILLQYTAPLWMFLASVAWLGERADRRGLLALAIGSLGILVIILGGWHDAQLPIIALGLGSGVAYAGVMICLRVLRDASSRWLTVLNHLFGALLLLTYVLGEAPPTVPQLMVLILFGAVQMAFPYWLVARGLRAVSPQEAGTITLLEPLLNPFWAYLVAGEVPSSYTYAGGAFIVGALAWRYWPRRRMTG